MLQLEQLREIVISLRTLRYACQSFDQLLAVSRLRGSSSDSTSDQTISPELWKQAERVLVPLVRAKTELDRLVVLLSSEPTSEAVHRFVPAAPGLAGEENVREVDVQPGPPLEAARELEFDATGPLRAPKYRPKRIAPGETKPRPQPPPLDRPRKR